VLVAAAIPIACANAPPPREYRTGFAASSAPTWKATYDCGFSQARATEQLSQLPRCQRLERGPIDCVPRETPFPLERISGFALGMTHSEFVARCTQLGGRPWGADSPYCKLDDPDAFVGRFLPSCGERASELQVWFEDVGGREALLALADALCGALGPPNVVRPYTVAWDWGPYSLHLAWRFGNHQAHLRATAARCEVLDAVGPGSSMADAAMDLPLLWGTQQFGTPRMQADGGSP
jgi:hypothetical protein